MDCIKKIGCFPSCNAIKFPYPALETGVHFVVFDWLGTKKTIAFEAVEGETFYIPNYFNESSDPIFSIKQPSGDYLCWDKELEALAVCPDDCGKDCDFYRHFTLEINQTSGLDGEDIPDYTFSNKVYNIDQAVDNGDGTYTIDVDGAVNGDLAVDDNGTFYEYQNGIWTIKFKEVCAFQDVDTLPTEGEDCALYYQGGKYWQWDGVQFVDVTPTIDFDDIDGLPNLVQSVTGNVVDNTDPKNPIVNIPDQVCSVQSYPTFAEFPLEPESCVLYIDESTKKQYIESGGNYLEVGSSENIYNTNGTLTGNRMVDLDGNALEISNQSGGYIALGDSSSGSNFALNILGDQIEIRVGSEGLYRRFRLYGSGLQLNPHGQNLFANFADKKIFLKLQNSQGLADWDIILSDDIDDSTSANKFVTQAEKDDIATAVQPGDLGTAAQANVGDFATAAQGAKADTAIQPGDLPPPQNLQSVTNENNTTTNPILFKTGGGGTAGWTTYQLSYLYVEGASSGTIVIKLPEKKNWIFSMEVSILSFASASLIRGLKYFLSAYYSSNSGVWSGRLTSSAFGAVGTDSIVPEVRYAIDSSDGAPCILFGNTTMGWSFLHVSIDRIISVYNNNIEEAEIYLTTDESAFTSIKNTELNSGVTATYEQGQKADTALQPGDVNTSPIPRLIMPDDLYCVVGYKRQLFFRSIIEDIAPFKYNIEISGNVGGDQLPRYYEFTPTAPGSRTLEMELRNNSHDLIAQHSMNVNFIAPATNPASVKRVLCFGDSLTAGNKWTGELLRMLTDAGGSPAGLNLSNIEFIGTQDNGGGNRNEGHSGKTWSWFIGTDSPFYNTGTSQIDFQNYVSTNSFGGIDYAISLLTWNGLYKGKPNASDHISMIDDAKVLLDRLKSDYPSVKFLLMGIPLPSMNGGLGANYGDDTSNYGNYFELAKTANGINLAYQELANDPTYSSWVQYCNVSIQFDNEYSYPFIVKNVNTRSSRTEDIDTNGVHPSIEGYMLIADAAFHGINNLIE